MDSQAIVNQILDEDTLFLVAGTTIALTAIVMGTICSVVKARARERSRREIAAYIAEGSMTPDQGERLMRAGGKE